MLLWNSRSRTGESCCHSHEGKHHATT